MITDLSYEKVVLELTKDGVLERTEELLSVDYITVRAAIDGYKSMGYRVRCLYYGDGEES